MTSTTKKSLWAKIQEMAVLDRESYLDAWKNTGNEKLIIEIEDEIARTKALKGLQLTKAMITDREGVRLAFLAAQCWFEALADSQVGAEKTLAIAMAKRVTEKRNKLFGRTKLEAMVVDTVSVPIHKVGQMLQSGLPPREFLDALNRE